MSFGGKDNRGPSIAELQRFVREKVDVVIMLNTGESVTGKLRWFDENAFSLVQDGQQPFTILRSAVVGYRKLGDEPRRSATTATRGENNTAAGQAASTQTMVSTQQEQQAQPAVPAPEEKAADDSSA